MSSKVEGEKSPALGIIKS